MQKQVILTLLCIALSACGSRFGPARQQTAFLPGRRTNPAAADVTAAAEPMAAEPAIAALTDTLGRPDALQASSRLPRDIAIAADDDRPRTGKQLDGEGIQAGSEATVSLKPLPGPRTRRTPIRWRCPSACPIGPMPPISSASRWCGLRAKLFQLIRFFWLILSPACPTKPAKPQF
ncbi:hypothetical protein M5W83_04590 [Paenibacillus thiaminolyticus]|uniref:Uncharacterized protein n=1 Tax=Paenibacillus thiaminolyticus TaxID=49283 RepID=A0AAP9DZ70_PANTH|nr:hypothetical protein [Paenibacillus thiaminolyticus]MCY9535081.1 hypothetical protein [Paenibacillus thiaminolyticus]MCY9600444.1 hypothetical protein [Paenibacillus thiaminolyticus]MCY9606437.1 hypothetical protein [Paenibacillus thiaminolyticus]MCY9616062.1 hypothetical protein [Paenibacillus thiaminolyticus]MCY9622354.1 hypothetical protein [Paenibacillus thiaminolyticus]